MTTNTTDKIPGYVKIAEGEYATPIEALRQAAWGLLRVVYKANPGLEKTTTPCLELLARKGMPTAAAVVKARAVLGHTSE